MSKDDGREKSLARTKKTFKFLLAMGLNAVVPGVGSATIALAEHINALVRDERLRRLNSFHDRMLEGDVTDEEITARATAMQDSDFQHLMSAMLMDIEAEKLPVYEAVYIHLVEQQSQMALTEKRMWVLATSQLQLEDMRELLHMVLDDERWWPSDACAHRLQSLELATADYHFIRGTSSDTSIFQIDRDRVSSTVDITDFGRGYARVIAPAFPYGVTDEQQADTCVSESHC